MIIDGRQILVDFERERIMSGWVPRRFGKKKRNVLFNQIGGGLGGRKESGQLRFGGRDRPFKKPFMKEIPEL